MLFTYLAVECVRDEFGIDFNLQYLKWLTAQIPMIANLDTQAMVNNDAEDIRKHLDAHDNNEKNLNERPKQVWKIIEKA